MPRIDGIHYEHELTVEDLQNIRGHLIEQNQRILGDIALVNGLIDEQMTPQLPFPNRVQESIAQDRS